MTTAIRAPYRTVDLLVLHLLVLRIDPTQKCAVVENQMLGDTHVKILRTGQEAPERVRNEDVMLLSASQTGETHD